LRRNHPHIFRRETHLVAFCSRVTNDVYLQVILLYELFFNSFHLFIEFNRYTSGIYVRSRAQECPIQFILH